MRAAIRHMIHTCYHLRWEGGRERESDADVIERLEGSRSVECDKYGGNLSRATSCRVKFISQLCRDPKVSGMAFDYGMRKFRERYYNRYSITGFTGKGLFIN